MPGISRLFKRRELDMTTGNEFRLLLAFALPLLAGNIFQQLYNVVDTWVVGNFVSDEAFSAVGTVAPIINMFISTFVGFSNGGGVVISQYYGAKNYEKVHDAVHTMIAMAIILAAVLSALGFLMVPTMLRLIKTPADVFPESLMYLRIYFAGVSGLLFYNMSAGILRAVGDSGRPVTFLVASAIINATLDLVFVLVFKMGVEGVALATIIAQGVSATMGITTLARTSTCVKLRLRDLKIHSDLLKKIVRVGIPAAIQMSITSFSNVFVMGYINQFGKYAMGGWTAYHKVDMIIVQPMQSLGIATSTFVGQNIGCGQEERARSGVRKALTLAIGITLSLSALVAVFAPALTAFFNDEPEVVRYGTLFMRWLTPLYFLFCINQVLGSALRGAGNSKATMVIMLFAFVAFRQTYMFVVSNFISNTVLPLAMGYPAGWFVCSLLTFLYYRSHGLKKSSIVAQNERR